MAQQEREKAVSRIKQGLTATVTKGTKLGRKPLQALPSEFVKKYEAYLRGEYGKVSNTDLAKMISISRKTLYKYIKLYETHDIPACRRS